MDNDTLIELLEQLSDRSFRESDASLEINKQVLSYIFPIGKYKGKTVRDVIIDDRTYVMSWFIQKGDMSLYDAYPYSLQLIPLAEYLIRKENCDAEYEYEQRRCESITKQGGDYQRDYEIRHNPALRDCGM